MSSETNSTGQPSVLHLTRCLTHSEDSEGVLDSFAEKARAAVRIVWKGRGVRGTVRE